MITLSFHTGFKFFNSFAARIRSRAGCASSISAFRPTGSSLEQKISSKIKKIIFCEHRTCDNFIICFIFLFTKSFEKKMLASFNYFLLLLQSLSKQNSRSSRRDSSDNDDQPSPVEEVAGEIN